RHTRSTRDWSSDVCSSDLIGGPGGPGGAGGRGGQGGRAGAGQRQRGGREGVFGNRAARGQQGLRGAVNWTFSNSALDARPFSLRSEERRVGNACRSRDVFS